MLSLMGGSCSAPFTSAITKQFSITELGQGSLRMGGSFPGAPHGRCGFEQGSNNSARSKHWFGQPMLIEPSNLFGVWCSIANAAACDAILGAIQTVNFPGI